MQPVNSSSISHIGYDPKSKQLTVRFHNGSDYTYSGVSAEEHQALLNANSIGKHFSANIRTKYKGIKL